MPSAHSIIQNTSRVRYRWAVGTGFIFSPLRPPLRDWCPPRNVLRKLSRNGNHSLVPCFIAIKRRGVCPHHTAASQPPPHPMCHITNSHSPLACHMHDDPRPKDIFTALYIGNCRDVINIIKENNIILGHVIIVRCSCFVHSNIVLFNIFVHTHTHTLRVATSHYPYIWRTRLTETRDDHLWRRRRLDQPNTKDSYLCWAYVNRKKIIWKTAKCGEEKKRSNGKETKNIDYTFHMPARDCFMMIGRWPFYMLFSPRSSHTSSLDGRWRVPYIDKSPMKTDCIF